MSSYTSSLYVIAAICGNFYQESTVNPGIWENLTPGAPGYGLGQWTDNAQVTRRTALFNWLGDHGYSRDSGPGQMAFLIDENVWLRTGAAGPSRFNSLSDFLASTSTDVNMLTAEFMHSWEGIEDGTLSVRQSFALDALTAMQNDDGTRAAWYSGNRYNSRSQALSNSLLIMDIMLDAPPVPSADDIAAVLAFARKRKLKGGIYLAF